jgi:hypothetical protein
VDPSEKSVGEWFQAEEEGDDNAADGNIQRSSSFTAARYTGLKWVIGQK